VSPVACTRPGCTGTIEDGYCNVCGLAARAIAPASASSAAPATASAGTAPSASLGSPTTATSTSRSSRSRRTSSRTSLGGGLVDVPPVAARDPSSVVLANPEVPEHKRFCGKCESPVGRSRAGKPGRTEGFCPNCGTAFSFSPKLGPDELVAGQYAIVGCIAHGGLGWIYLARDRNVSDRWVVLKGLLDSGDEAAMMAAIAERRFLAEVEHPSIVRIYNFVEHEDAGYIVMEYVGGESLKQVRSRVHADSGKPIPVAQAIAYMLEMLPALGYLHERGLLYCDFKPDNTIQIEQRMKLIDLGGVRRIDDDTSDLYGTVGYQAPEIAQHGASIASDLYTVARTLAVLTMDFPFQDERSFATALPTAADQPVLEQYECVQLFLERATATEPGRRFISAAEMGDQLLGVLRQVIAIDGGRPPTAPSRLFTGEPLTTGELAGFSGLPTPTVDPADAAAGMLANLSSTDPEQIVSALKSTTPTVETGLRLTRALIDIDLGQAEEALATVEAMTDDDWRIQWWRAAIAIASGRTSDAVAMLRGVMLELPGELAPRLALAVASELAAAAASDPTARAGFYAAAAHQYDLVSRCDPSYASAGFGLGRTRLAVGDRAGAAAALRRIPEASSAYAAAQSRLCQLLCTEIDARPPELADLVAASSALDGLRADPEARASLRRDLLSAALGGLEDGEIKQDQQQQLAGVALTEFGVRSGLEETYRTLAHLAPTRTAQMALVDEANRHRPRTRT
jgi:serine/threonine-protein kinase PknG